MQVCDPENDKIPPGTVPVWLADFTAEGLPQPFSEQDKESHRSETWTCSSLASCPWRLLGTQGAPGAAGQPAM